MFSGVPQSCLKQVPTVPRRTMVSAETGAENEQLRAETIDKVGAFLSFCDAIIKPFSKHYHIICTTVDIYLSKTDVEGRSVIQFNYFQQAHSAFGFLHFKCV